HSVRLAVPRNRSATAGQSLVAEPGTCLPASWVDSSRNEACEGIDCEESGKATALFCFGLSAAKNYFAPCKTFPVSDPLPRRHCQRDDRHTGRAIRSGHRQALRPRLYALEMPSARSSLVRSPSEAFIPAGTQALVRN